MFTRNNRLDYQLFFNTRGAFRPVGLNGLIAVVCFSDLFAIVGMGIGSMAIILATGRILCELKLHICNPLRRATLLWSPLVAILLQAPYISDLSHNHIYGYNHPQINPWARWMVFTALLVPVLLVTISRLRFTRIVKLVDSVLGSRQVFWRQVILTLCMIAALVTQVFMVKQNWSFSVNIIVQVCALAVVSFGNFQIPASVMRVVLALLRFGPLKNNTSNDNNLVASLRIFYGMVLGQGMLYVVACVLEFFSFIPRRSLVHCGGFRGQWGAESVNLYYAYAFDKCMQEGVLAPKKISLSTFAMDFVNSDSSKNQLYGIRMMHSFLQTEPAKAQLLSKLTNCSKTMARIIKMLDWLSPKDTSIRLYAAKVTTELAKNLYVVSYPGMMQHISALLDDEYDSRPRKGNPLLDTDDEKDEQDSVRNTENMQEKEHDMLRWDVADNQEQRRDQLPDTDNMLEMQDVPRDVTDNQEQRQDQLLGTDNMLETQDVLRDAAGDQEQRQDRLPGTDNRMETQASSTQPTVVDEQSSRKLRCWQKISEFWSIPEELLLTHHDLLPAVAMSIIDNLAGCGQDNCVEISKAADLIPKIIGYTSYRSDTMDTEARKKVLLKSSLKVLQRLTRTDGEIGITLRYEISKHPFLLRNLTEISSTNSQEFRKLVAGILRNIAVDGSTRQEIGRIQLLISMLMQAFLNAEEITSTNVDHFLPKVAGQALAMLTTESEHNCLLMLKEPEFINKLTAMILSNDDKYIYVASSLLRNLCLHAEQHLTELDKTELHHPLQKMFKTTMDVEGAELEVLIGLSSQICKVIRKDFMRELDGNQIKGRFVKRIVDALNANTKPSAYCPGIRRVILEQVIYMLECNSSYVDCFNNCSMKEALLMVEQTLSKAENYRLFLGNTGLMEYQKPISDLVARAKELMGCD